jgi:Zn finger protein HypA/HybF involved in hydrogenase expression
MCSVGDAFGVDVAHELNAKNYKCKDCENEFQGIGKNVICPACRSSNVELA